MYLVLRIFNANICLGKHYEHDAMWRVECTKNGTFKKTPEKFIAFFIYNDEILISSRLRLES